MPYQPLSREQGTSIPQAASLSVYQNSIPTVSTTAERESMFPLAQRHANVRVRNLETGFQEVWRGVGLGWVQEFSLAAGDEGSPQTPDEDALAGEPYLVVISQNPARVRAGGTLQLNVSVVDRFGTATALGARTYSVLNATLAQVNSTGLVQGLNPGTTKVSVSVTWLRLGEDTPRTVQSPQVNLEVSGAVASVTITPNPLPIEEGQAAYPLIVARDAGNRIVEAPVAVSIEDDTVVDVAGTEIIGLASGSSEVYAVVEGVEGVAVAQVTGPLASVDALPSPVPDFTAPGQTAQLAPVGRDAASVAIPGLSYAYESSDLDVATVSSTGLVTAGPKRGACTILVTATQGALEVTDTTAVTTDYEVIFKYVAGVTSAAALGAIVERDFIGSYVDAGGATQPATNSNVARVTYIGGVPYLKVIADGEEGGTYERIKFPLFNTPGLNAPFTVLYEWRIDRNWLEAQRMGSIFAFGTQGDGANGSINALGSPDGIDAFMTNCKVPGEDNNTSFGRPGGVVVPPALGDVITCRITVDDHPTDAALLIKDNYWAKNGGAESMGWAATQQINKAIFETWDSWGTAPNWFVFLGYSLVDIGSPTPMLTRRVVWRRGIHSLATMQAT